MAIVLASSPTNLQRVVLTEDGPDEPPRTSRGACAALSLTARVGICVVGAHGTPRERVGKVDIDYRNSARVRVARITEEWQA